MGTSAGLPNVSTNTSLVTNLPPTRRTTPAPPVGRRDTRAPSVESVIGVVIQTTSHPPAQRKAKEELKARKLSPSKVHKKLKLLKKDL